MKKNSKIYVAGHTGLIGSGLVRVLKARGFQKVITRTRRQLNLTDRIKAQAFFRKERPQYVFLAAARVGGIRANDTYPGEFIFQNLMIQTNVLDLAHRFKVKKLLFLASSCVYPKESLQPMKEQYLMTGKLEPTNEPYGMAKLAGIEMVQAYRRQYGSDFICCIPANVYGINDHFDESGHVLAALIEKFHQAKSKRKKTVSVWGTGKPRREFFYVDDLADACLFLMDHYSRDDVINVGPGRETSIRTLARAVQEIVGFTGVIHFDTKKPDGNLRRLLDSSNMHNFGWRSSISLEEGLRLTYDWYLARQKWKRL